jgi:peptide/nickel transport system substrate-binding protein
VLARRAFQTIADDVPAIWLYDVVLIDAVNRRINVGVTRPDGWSVDMGTWSIDPAKRIDRDRIGLGAR